MIKPTNRVGRAADKYARSIIAAGGGKSGAGGGGGTHEDPNTLLSVQYARMIMVACEGEIKGLVDGLRSVYLNKTPLLTSGAPTITKLCDIASGNKLIGLSTQALEEMTGLEEGMLVSGTGIPLGAKILSISATAADGFFFAIDRDPSTTINGTELTFTSSSYANFKDFAFYYRYGTQDQAAIPGFNSIETPLTGIPTTAIETASAPILTVTDEAADAIRVSISVPVFQTQFIDGGNVNIRGSRVQYAIDLKPAGGSFTEVVSDVIEGKCTSPYIRSHRIELTGDGPWDVRIRRITPDSMDQAKVDKIYWHSLISIIDLKLNYPNTVVFAGQFDARQLSSIPAVGLDLLLTMVKIPTNYNPYTRTYATTGPGTTGGIWDGTFKVDWTDNPAWAFYDLMTNERYGLGTFVSQTATDKWQLYQIAQYCDELVPDGYGGMEPRFSCNLFLQTREEAFRVIANMASIFRGMIYWSGGSLQFFQDSPADAEVTFTQANVIGGLFNYSGTARKARHNTATVFWNDPEDFSTRKPEQVQERDAIRDQREIRDLELTAFGCSSRGQARRVGRWALYSEQYETETVNFETSLAGQGTSLYPGQVINIVDPCRAGVRLGGRIVAASTTGLTLDAPVEMETGKIYTAILINKLGQMVLRPLNNPVATVTDVTFAIPLPSDDVPLVMSDWAISVNDLTPQTFRVLMVTESSPTTFKVGALAYNSGKYDYIEKDIPFNDPDITSLPPSTSFVEPPTAVVVSEEFDVVSDDLERQLTVSWTHSIDKYLKDYTVEYRTDSDNWKALPNTSSNSLTFRVRTPTSYTVRVRANNTFGRSSANVYAYYELDTDILLPGAVTGLELFGQGNDTVFEGKDPHFVWRYNSPDTTSDGLEGGKVNPLFDVFVVKLYDARPTTPVLLRTEYVIDSTYTYLYSNNFIDTGGNPTREIKVVVAMRDINGQLSRAATETFTNPVPVVGSVPPTLDPTKIRISSRAGFVTVNYTKPIDSDFVGMKIFVSSNPAFALTDVRPAAGDPPSSTALIPYDVETNTGMLLFSGSDSAIALPLSSTGTYYLIFAPFDAFGDEDILYYGPVSTSVSLTVDTTPPEVPTGLVVTSESSIDGDGSQRVVIRAKFNPNSEADLFQYGWYIRQASGTPNFSSGALTGYTPSTQVYQAITGGLPARTASGGYVQGTDSKVTLEWIVRPGAYYEVRISAIDTSGNASDYTALTTSSVVQAGADTSPPDAPTWISATTEFRFIKLRWNPNSESDFNLYHVYQGTTNVFSAATKIRETATTSLDIQLPVTGQITTTTYYFFLVAIDNSGNESDPSAAQTAILPEIAVPTSLTLTTGVELDTDGTQRVYLDASWTDSSTVEVISYTVELSTSSGTANVERKVVTSTKTRFWVTGNTFYYVRARANDGNAGYSTYSAESTITSAKDTTAPAAPTSFAGNAAIRSVFLTWVSATAKDLAYTRIYRNTTGTTPVPGTTTPLFDASGTAITDNSTVAGTTYYYWATSVDTSGNETVTPVAMTPAFIIPGNIEAADIDGFSIDITSMYHTTIALASDAWTNNSPSSGHIAWNSHTIYYQGNGYTVAAGDTTGVAANKAYVYWDSAAPTVYSVSATNPALTDAQFMIATNVNGAHDLAWNAFANAVIGTAYIENLAVTNAKIYDLAVDKLTAGSINSQEIVITGGTAGILRSDNYVAGTSGWKIDGAGKLYAMEAVFKGGVTVGTPGTSGLYMGADKIGYFDGSAWTSYINSSGDMILGSKLSYTAGTGVLSITGYISVGGAASDVNGNATTISGGKITSGTITANEFNATITTTKELVIDTNGVIRSAGATAYGTGTGFWIKKTSGGSEFRFGSPGGQEIKWDGTDLTLTGGINITGLTTLATVATTGAYTNLTGSPINASTGALSLSPAPSGSGLFLGNSHMGYYASSAWKTYIDSSGNLKLVGSADTLQWNGTAFFTGAGTFNNSTTPFYLDHNGNFSLKNKLSFDGTTLTIDGDGTFSGTLDANTIGSNGLIVTSVRGLRYQDNNGVFTITGGSDNGYSNGGQIDLQGVGLNNGNAGCVVLSAGNHADGQIHFRTSNTLRGLVKRNGDWDINNNLSALTLSATSAARFKKNIRPIEEALQIVQSLSGHRFDWVDRNITNDIGVIAEEVATVLPTLVHCEKDGSARSVEYGKLTAVLIEAVKELNLRLHALEHLHNK